MNDAAGRRPCATQGLALVPSPAPLDYRAVSMRRCTDPQLWWACETYLPAYLLPFAQARLAELMIIAMQADAAAGKPAQKPGHPEGGIGSFVEMLIAITSWDEKKARSWVARVLGLPHARVSVLHRQWRMRNRNP